MTRDKFEKIQAARGYTVERMGLITFLHSKTREGRDYTAMWFWKPDGSLNEAMKPSWHIA